MRLILGSQSPRRREILNFFKIPFEQAVSSFPEKNILYEGNPQKYVLDIAKGKSNSLFDFYRNDLILTADSIVFSEGTVYGKPTDEQEAYRVLKSLQGKWHSVLTAIVARHGQIIEQSIEETKVLFNSLTDTEINQYVETQKWSDKAAGYAIQMSGGLIVKRIEGCYYNVMGLPINTVRKSLKPFGIDLWNYLG